MALCPVMSRKGDEVSCKEKNCEWWVEIEGRPGIGVCAVKRIAINIDMLNTNLVSDLANIIRAIRKT